MPELSEVEFARSLIEKNALKGYVKEIKFHTENEVPDEIIFTKVAAEYIQTVGQGHQVLEVGRWGKQLWIVLDKATRNGRDALLIHLGMTGFVQFKGTDRLWYEGASLKEQKKEKEEQIYTWPPRFTKFIITFTSAEREMEMEMAFCDPRIFATIDVIEELSTTNTRSIIIEKFKLGFDPLNGMLSLKVFEKELNEFKRKINVKTLLMEQTFVAGLGNWMADDILMEARILPQRTVTSLSKSEISALHKAIKKITDVSVEANADKSKFPKIWLFHIRWRHGDTTLSGLKVSKGKIAGRSTFWIPALQK